MKSSTIVPLGSTWQKPIAIFKPPTDAEKVNSREV